MAASATNSAPMQRHEGDIAIYASDRLGAQPSPDWARWLKSQMPYPPEMIVSAADDSGSNPHVLIHRFQLGTTQLVALERNIAYHMSESLKQAGGNERLEKPVRVTVVLKNAAYVYDLRAQTLQAHGNRFTLEIDPWKPTLLALSAGPMAETNLVNGLLEASR